VGFVSSLTGVGGGVFLAPILIALHWASPKQTAAQSPPFILANSVVGLAGALYSGQVPSGQTWLYAIGAFAGAIVGTVVGLRAGYRRPRPATFWRPSLGPLDFNF
jgi:uncharacterized membrane protein YfcA